MVFLVFTIFFEYSVLGTLIRINRKPSTKEVTIPMTKESSILKTMSTNSDVSKYELSVVFIRSGCEITDFLAIFAIVFAVFAKAI